MENIKRVDLRMAISMYKKWVVAGLAILFSAALGAQDKLVIKGKAPNQYVAYKTDGRESLLSISNGFGMSVQKLAAYNKININANKAFAKGTEVKIPVTQNNLLQHPAENAEPVVHILAKGENLFRVSQAYHKVPVASLRSWNNLKKDAVKAGQPIIIGYMVNAKSATVADKKVDVKKEETNTANVAAETKSEPVKDIPATLGNKGVQAPPPAEKIYTEKKTPSAPTPVRNDVIVNPPVREAVGKAPEKKIEIESNTAYVPKEGDEGYFALAYSDHPKEQTQQFRSGDAAIFKTISGWTDRKFYVLMNDIAPKTIVRITGAGNKSICAMVLGPLQETKGANGLLLRMSNSAASALGLTAEKFTVTVTYFE